MITRFFCKMRATSASRGKDSVQPVMARAIGPVQQIKNEDPNTNALLVLLGPRVDEKPTRTRRSDADAPELGGGGVGAKKPSLVSSLLKTYSGALPQAPQQGQDSGEAQPPAKRPALNPFRRSV